MRGRSVGMRGSADVGRTLPVPGLPEEHRHRTLIHFGVPAGALRVAASNSRTSLVTCSCAGDCVHASSPVARKAMIRPARKPANAERIGTIPTTRAKQKIRSLLQVAIRARAWHPGCGAPAEARSSAHRYVIHKADDQPERRVGKYRLERRLDRSGLFMAHVRRCTACR